MSEHDDLTASDQIIGTISNRNNPEQGVAIRYLRRESAFVTSGIKTYLGMKEILVPVHLVAVDLQLVGAILSAILEKISHSHEMDLPFHYVSRFEVLGKEYSLTEYGEFMKLEAD
ncbi:MAG: hypothetical protein KKE57_11570 [Proteobacteria bacterium]|nr:hypothetical protein [Pseudomonadota bacterium]